MDDSTRILIIDDDPALLIGLQEAFKHRGGFDVLVADNGEEGIKLAQDAVPHLIVCDLMMPPPDGHAILKRLMRHPSTASIPFIFLTARTSRMDVIHSINLGADDYITKPFNNDELFARVNALLRRREKIEVQERYRNEKDLQTLGHTIQEMIRNFATNQDGFAEALAQMLSLRDHETEEHGRRVVYLSERLARQLGMGAAMQRDIYLGALLHDIGKVGIPDAILLKTGSLTEAERAIMKTHSELGQRILFPLGLPAVTLELVHYHHERWDGSGYPQGLAGEAIPMAARIFAVVDVYDALTNDRPYRPAMPQDQALAYIQLQSGKHFEPRIVAEFLKLMKGTRGG